MAKNVIRKWRRSAEFYLKNVFVQTYQMNYICLFIYITLSNDCSFVAYENQILFIETCKKLTRKLMLAFQVLRFEEQRHSEV